MANIDLNCPECGRILEIDGAGAELKVICPNCDADLLLSLIQVFRLQSPDSWNRGAP
jgi:hypothetical protein